MPVVLFAGVVGARNFTMECRKGRRKGLLSGLVFAWLLTSGCTVAARNIGECQGIYDFSARRFQTGDLSTGSRSLSLCQLRLLTEERANIYALHVSETVFTEPLKNYSFRVEREFRLANDEKPVARVKGKGNRRVCFVAYG